MRSLLSFAAMLAVLSAPALAGSVTTEQPPPPGVQAAAAPAPDDAAPPSQAEAQDTASMPMPALLDANAPPPARSGCHHEQQSTQYLTN